MYGQKCKTSGYHCVELAWNLLPREWVLSYLVQDIVEGVGAVDGKTDKDEVGLRVRERSQAIIFFLASCVPQSKLHSLTGRRMSRVGNVVLKDRGDVFLFGTARVSAWTVSQHMAMALHCHSFSYLWEVALAVADEQTRLAAASVTHDDNLLRKGRGLGGLRPGGLAAARGAHGGADGAFTGAGALVRTILVMAGLVVVGVPVLVRRHRRRSLW